MRRDEQTQLGSIFPRLPQHAELTLNYSPVHRGRRALRYYHSSTGVRRSMRSYRCMARTVLAMTRHWRGTKSGERSKGGIVFSAHLRTLIKCIKLCGELCRCFEHSRPRLLAGSHGATRLDGYIPQTSISLRCVRPRCVPVMLVPYRPISVFVRTQNRILRVLRYCLRIKAKDDQNRRLYCSALCDESRLTRCRPSVLEGTHVLGAQGLEGSRSVPSSCDFGDFRESRS